MSSNDIQTFIILPVLLCKTKFQIAVHGFSIWFFGTSFLFILKFLGSIFIIFLISAALSHLFKLDKFYENSIQS
jgi:hypothetical protein